MPLGFGFCAWLEAGPGLPAAPEVIAERSLLHGVRHATHACMPRAEGVLPVWRPVVFPCSAKLQVIDCSDFSTNLDLTVS